MSLPIDSALLQYNYSDTNTVVAYCNTVNRTPTLLNYLITNSISSVSSLPSSTGIYCVEESGIHKVYTIYYDSDSSIYVNVYQYSLGWLDITI
jgi:hypothetical protein